MMTKLLVKRLIEVEELALVNIGVVLGRDFTKTNRDQAILDQRKVRGAIADAIAVLREADSDEES